jgi:hypothetical protein
MPEPSTHFGSFLLGYGGVMLMVSIWCFAVACVFLPLRHGNHPKYTLPGLLLVLCLALLPSGDIWLFALLLFVTSIIMGPAVLLVSGNRRTTLWRGVVILVVTVPLALFGPLIYEKFDPLSWIGVPLQVLGPAVGSLLLAESTLKKRAWYAPACAALFFTTSWVVWSGRDYFYRLA